MKGNSRTSNVFGLPFGDLTPVGLTLPDDLDAEQWEEVGLALGRSKGVLMWAVGDWWAFGEHRYGERIAITKSEDWDGPAFQTCANAATVCRQFETSSREEAVSFRKHQAIAVIGDEEWRLKVLAWVAKEKPTFLAIEQRVKEVRAHLAQGWTPDQADRKARAERGECVVANLREVNGRQADAALLAWAETNDRFVRIDRQTEWGNPFEMPDDGSRQEVIAKFNNFYLPYKNGLQKKLPTLRGKVLACWCHPEQCHGHIIAEIVNCEAKGSGSIEQLVMERI